MPDEARVPLLIRLPPTVKADLRKLAWDERISMSRLVEDAIQDRLRQKESELAVAV